MVAVPLGPCFLWAISLTCEKEKSSSLGSLLEDVGDQALVAFALAAIGILYRKTTNVSVGHSAGVKARLTSFHLQYKSLDPSRHLPRRRPASQRKSRESWRRTYIITASKSTHPWSTPAQSASNARYPSGRERNTRSTSTVSPIAYPSKGLFLLSPPLG
jgi:hypothetical protein